MAHVRSLGVHRPSGLEYLYNEGILPQNANSKDYHWKTYAFFNQDDGIWIEEEILRTSTTVVWSQGGVIKRVYGLDIEKEAIVEAFVTSFVHRGSDNSDRSSEVGHSSNPTGQEKSGKEDATTPDTRSTLSPRFSQRALVVVLHSQVYVYFLSGDSHVIPLSFEVESALPAPTGFLLQRKALKPTNSPPAPAAPPNSFASSGLSPDLRRLSSFTPRQGRDGPSLTVPSIFGPDSHCSPDVPTLFSILDPQGEVGLVTVKRRHEEKAVQRETRLDPLDPDETLIYLSRKDELNGSTTDVQQIYIAVTSNAKANTYTAWTVAYKQSFDAVTPARKRRRVDTTALSRRRSSNVFGRSGGAATPIVRNTISVRESIGGLTVSQLEQHNDAEVREGKPTEFDALASQFEPDFGQHGVQTRAARRVSSMLARTDLGTNQDRSTFNEIATGHPGRASLGRNFRRGESIGGFSDRTSFGPRRRSSLRGTSSLFSEGTSFLDAPVDQLLRNLDDSGEFRGFDTMALHEPTSSMPKEVVFTKLGSVPWAKGGRRPALDLGQRPRVFTITSPRTLKAGGTNTVEDNISVCIMQKQAKELLVLGIRVMREEVRISPTRTSRNKAHEGEKKSWKMSFRDVTVQRGSNISDASKLEDGPFSRMLLLSETRDGSNILVLEVPWGTSMRIDIPTKMAVYDTCSLSPNIKSRSTGSARRREALPSEDIGSVQGFSNVSSYGRIDLIDQENKNHRVEIRLQPKDCRVSKILLLASLALKDHLGDGIHVAWWEVMKWLSAIDSDRPDEWKAMVIVLFCLAVPFIPGKHPRRQLDRTARQQGTRTSSQSQDGGDAWSELWATELRSATSWTSTSPWGWISEKYANGPNLTSSALTTSESRTGISMTPASCAALAREFLQTPAGETAHGPEGYLPTAISKARDLRQTSLATLLLGMHLLVEEDKLDVRKASRSAPSLRTLTPMLAQLGRWLGWSSWTWKDDSYYGTDIGDCDETDFEDTQITLLDVPKEPFEPPSIFVQLESWLQGTSNKPWLSLLDVLDYGAALLPWLWRSIKELTPRLQLLQDVRKGFDVARSDADRVQFLTKLDLDQETLESLPEGIGAFIHETLTRVQYNPPANWIEQSLRLVDRDDLLLNQTRHEPFTTMTKVSMLPHHEALRDSHTIGNVTLETEPHHFFDSSAEADRQFVTRLIYHADRRFQDAAKLVNQLRPPVAECVAEADWTEADLLEAQKELVQLVTLRTLAVSSGRGMMNYNARIPLLTDKVPIPAFTLQCQMRPMNVTFSADRASFSEEKVCWAFFHNGVATGLTISRAARGVDTSWILYNKPPDLTNRHAGFLLGLGLNGHLKALAKWVAFKYLTPKHTMVSIGLLLGLSASYLGTMDTLITRLLSVHVTRMLPPGAAELNLSPLTQTAGIMGLGLLYTGSQHRRMSEVMISEIENTEMEESPQNILRDEGYRLAAGFALGFINLGKGKDLRGLHDMGIVERLLGLAIGTKNVNLVHVLDRATAGACVAVALIFLKTDNEAIARKIDVPDTVHQFDYVRPDIFLLRTLARHLIMWSKVEPNENWIREALPKAYRDQASLSNVLRLSSEDMPFFNIIAGLCLALGLRYAGSGSQPACKLLLHYLDEFIRLTRLSALNYDAKLTRNSVRNCQDVVALAVSAVMAGTGDLGVFRRLRALHGRIDSETPYGSHLAAHMAIGSLFLGGGTHTFSTSNLAVASLLSAFYPVFPTFVLDNKAHLQAFRHFWVLAAEPRCLIPRDLATYRPINAPLNMVLRSGKVEQLTAPCLLPPFSTIASIRTLSPDHWTIDMNFERTSTLPPAFTNYQSIYLRRRSPYEASLSSSSSIFVSSLQAHANADPTPRIISSAMAGAANSARALQQGAGSTIPLNSNSSFEWLFELQGLKEVDIAEQCLVLPALGSSLSNVFGPSRMALLRSTVVDTKLSLEKGILPDNLHSSAANKSIGRVEKDRLWQLRLLFSWVEALERQAAAQQERAVGGLEVAQGKAQEASQTLGGEPMWLRRQLIEGLRWRVWKLGNGVGEDNPDPNANSPEHD